MSSPKFSAVLLVSAAAVASAQSTVVYTPIQRTQSEITFNMIVRGIVLGLTILSLLAVCFVWRRRMQRTAQNDARLAEMGLPPAQGGMWYPAPAGPPPPQYFYPPGTQPVMPPAAAYGVGVDRKEGNDMPAFTGQK